MEKKIIIDGVEYELTPKKVLTDEEFVKYVLEKHKIDFNVGDIVWYKGKSIRKECGETKFKVLSFEPYLIGGIRVDDYLNVNLESLTSGTKVSFFTSHLEKYIGGVQIIASNCNIPLVSVSVCCENCKHETPRHSIMCNSCLRFRNFEAK